MRRGISIIVEGGFPNSHQTPGLHALGAQEISSGEEVSCRFPTLFQHFSSIRHPSVPSTLVLSEGKLLLDWQEGRAFGAMEAARSPPGGAGARPGNLLRSASCRGVLMCIAGLVAATMLPPASSAKPAGKPEQGGGREEAMQRDSAPHGGIAHQGTDLVHIFYYAWFGTPEVDGKWQHWDHEVLPHWDATIGQRFASGRMLNPPGEFGANFFPARGLYSSKDSGTLDGHMSEMKETGAGVVVMSWWRKGWGSEKIETDTATLPILDAAARAGLRVAFHLEPYEGRSVSDVRNDVEYIIEAYGSHPAFYRNADGMPVYYCYDSYRKPVADWAELLLPRGSATVRGTALDGVYLGLFLSRGHEVYATEGGFDGLYTYFASTDFSDGARLSEWPRMVSWSRERKKLFVPCVGPGYDDTRIRPWNEGARRGREGGGYYERMWEHATRAGAELVAVTSFNEWAEGTQIEPAREYRGKSGFEYQGYGDGKEGHYIALTRKWVGRLTDQGEARREVEEDAVRAALDEAQARRHSKDGGQAARASTNGQRPGCDVCYSASTVSDVDRQIACAACSGNSPPPMNGRGGRASKSSQSDQREGGGWNVGGMETGMSAAHAVQSEFSELRHEVEGLLKVLQALREEESSKSGAECTSTCSSSSSSSNVHQGQDSDGEAFVKLKERTDSAEGRLANLWSEVAALRAEIKAERDERIKVQNAAESAIRMMNGKLDALIGGVAKSADALRDATR